MDNFPQDNVQHVNNAAVADCLCNPLVVRKILKHFSNYELLKLSFVNKLWKFEARKVLKKRGNIIPCLKCDNYNCGYQVETLAVLLLRMNVVPFSGLTFEIGGWDATCQTEGLDSIHEIILERLPVKSISISVAGEWWRYTECPTFELASKAVKHFCGVLEVLQLSIGLEEQEQFMEELVGDCSFPRLKVLHVWELSASDEMVAKEFVSHAPNLQELRADRPINLMLNVLGGSSAVAVCTSRICAPFNEIPENSINAIRLESMELVYTGPQFDFERFNRITPMLFQTSGNTHLRHMSLDAVLALPLISYVICLENVKQLDLSINHRQLEQFEPRILRLLRDFDFTRIFPTVKTVRICCDADHVFPDHMDTIIGEAIAFLKEPLPDQAENIKELTLWKSLSNYSFPFFAEMLPNIQYLVVSEYGEEQTSFVQIWMNLIYLQELDVHPKKLHGNLDGAICGIFPEEVAELREKDDEYLKRVNIVPIAPSITCLRSLRILRLNYYFVPSDQLLDDPSLVFSKVSGLTAFARCRDLAVTLETNDFRVYNALGHMKPYASVVHNSSDFYWKCRSPFRTF